MTNNPAHLIIQTRIGSLKMLRARAVDIALMNGVMDTRQDAAPYDERINELNLIVEALNDFEELITSHTGTTS